MQNSRQGHIVKRLSQFR